MRINHISISNSSMEYVLYTSNISSIIKHSRCLTVSRSHFGVTRCELGPKEVLRGELQRDILTLEEQEGALNYKFGVVLCRDGQLSEDQLYSNCTSTYVL